MKELIKSLPIRMNMIVNTLERLCFGVLKATCKHVDMTADMILAE